MGRPYRTETPRPRGRRIGHVGQAYLTAKAAKDARNLAAIRQVAGR